MPQSALAKSVIILLAMFVGFYSVAAMWYPGGTWLDHSRTGYSFWENYLCDLIPQTSISGEQNPGYIFARISYGSIIVALSCFWILLYRLFAPIAPRLSRIQLMCAIVAIGGFIALAMLEVEDKTLSAHSISALITIFTGITATIMPFFMFIKYEHLRSLGRLGLTMLTPCLLTVVVYVAYQVGFLPTDKFIPAAQKICIFCALVMITRTAYKTS